MGNYRVSGGYTFPWEIQLSGVFQSLPTEPIAGTGAAARSVAVANYTVTNATRASRWAGRLPRRAAPSLCPWLIRRTHTQTLATASTKVDLRVTKGRAPAERYRVDIMADFYNAVQRGAGPDLHDNVWARVVDAADVPAVRPTAEARWPIHVLDARWLQRRRKLKMLRTRVPAGWIIAAALFPGDGCRPDVRSRHSGRTLRRSCTPSAPCAIGRRGGADVAHVA